MKLVEVVDFRSDEKKKFLTRLFCVRRESGKRGRETTNLTQNQKVRGFNYFYFFLFTGRNFFIFKCDLLLCLSLSFTDSYRLLSLLLHFDKQLMRFSANSGRYVCRCATE